MKDIFRHINKIFSNKIRLGIMSMLMVNEQMDFNTLKRILEVTDGNLASHLKALEKAGYISVHKSFLGRKPHTAYKATDSGRKAFEQHIEALENLIKRQKE